MASRLIAFWAVVLYLSCAARAGEPVTAQEHFERAEVALKARRADEAWVHVRKAVRADVDHAEAARLFMALWMGLDQQGLMNAGRTNGEVVKAIGPPDDKHRAGEMLQFEYGFMAIDFVGGQLVAIIDRRGLTSAALRQHERVALEHDGRDWTLGHRQVNRTQVNTEYVLPGQSVQNWRELLSEQRLIGLARQNVPLREFMERTQRAIESAAPEATWNVIRESEREIVYEFIVPEGGAHDAQHEVTRLVLGEHDLHRLAYVCRGAPMSDGERDAWVNTLGGSRLEPVDQSVSTGSASAAP